ncbi:MAG: DUF6600 domain-containing protein [Pseudomonadota bacterium]
MSKNPLRALALLSLSLAFGAAHAQDDQAYESDPPDRAARLSYLQGEVSLQPAGEDEWADAIVNRPLTTGDKLWLDEGARAEIYVGQAAVRLGSNTGFSFLNVDDDTIQMRMTAGVIDVNVHALEGNEQIEVDTPNIALSILRPGRYRVEVNDAGDTTVVKVSEGTAEASAGSHSTVVHAQQAATFRGDEDLVAQLGTLGAPDEFDSWSLERDRRDERAATSETARYVAPDVTGYQDLDDNGTWASEPEYGYVWTPSRVSVGWSPYRDGRWVWVAPWGWTWIDDMPWGYAPFHYGRWAHVRERWCWVPGPRHVRAVYAPALVGWVGSPGVGVSVAIGNRIGWFPLGPREVYVPGRRFSHRYVERVNVHNTVIVNRTYVTNVYDNRERNMTYRNRAVPGAVTAVPRATFTSAERVGNHRIRIDEREISRTPATALAPQIAPGRESRLGAAVGTRMNGRVPPRNVENRQVVVKRAPPPASARFTRGDGTNNVPREQPVREQRAREINQENGSDRGRVFDDRNTRDTRAWRSDRPARSQPNTQPATQTRADRQPQQDQPPVAVSRPAPQTTPPRDWPQRTQEQRQRPEPQERGQADLQRRQQYEQQRDQQRQSQEIARAARQAETRQTERRVERQPVERPPVEQRTREVERPRVERPPERQERQQPAQPRQQPTERNQPREWRGNDRKK